MLDKSNVLTHFNRLCDFGGRLCGTDSEKSALNYVSDYLSSLNGGIIKFHPVEYDGWECIDSCILISGHEFEAVPLPGCSSLPVNGVNLNVVDAGRGTPDELKRLSNEIAGRAVLVTHEYMFAADHVHRSRKLEMAASLGAAVFLIANPWEDSGMVSGDGSPLMSGFGVSKKTADALREAADQSSKVHFKLDCHSQVSTTQTIDWFLPSNDQLRVNDDKEIIICAHIDGHALSESAMDNASGVAVALALASQLSKKKSYSFGIRILIFSAEERGLIGSEKYVATLSNTEKKNIIGVLNLDCVAGNKKLCAMTSGFDFLNAIVSESSNKTGIDVEIFEPLVPNSDHYNFAVQGIPSLRLIAGFGEQDSKLRDVLTSADKRNLVDLQELDNACRVVESLIDSMGNCK